MYSRCFFKKKEEKKKKLTLSGDPSPPNDPRAPDPLFMNVPIEILRSSTSGLRKEGQEMDILLE